MAHIYLAAPLFSQAERNWNEFLAKELYGIGHMVYLPQRDNKEKYPDQIFVVNAKKLKEADFVVAVLDHADVDSGTAWECGFAKAIEKMVYGLRTDFRRGGDDHRYDMNIMISCGVDVVFNDLALFMDTMKAKM